MKIYMNAWVSINAYTCMHSENKKDIHFCVSYYILFLSKGKKTRHLTI